MKDLISGDLVWTQGLNGRWYVNFFSHYADNWYYCFLNQQKEGNVFGWEIIRSFDDNPLIK